MVNTSCLFVCLGRRMRMMRLSILLLLFVGVHIQGQIPGSQTPCTSEEMLTSLTDYSVVFSECIVHYTCFIKKYGWMHSTDQK